MLERESKSPASRVTLSGAGAIGEAVAAAREFAKARNLPPDSTARLCVLAEEIVANVFDHGGLAAADRVALCFAAEPRGIRVVLHDPGRAFDPRDRTDPVHDSERGGGAGIGILLAWGREIEYARNRGRNRLSLLLPF